MKKIIFPILVALIVAGVSAIFFWNPYIKILLPAYLGSSSAQYKASEYYAERVKQKEKSGNKDNNSRDSKSVVKWLKKCAEKGNADCQNDLGMYFLFGEDYATAMQWLMKAAEKDNYKAQCNIGELYKFGLGVEKNYSKAVGWYEKSVQKNSFCLSNLGSMYEFGLGVKQDYSKALELYKKSAEDGNAHGEYSLGMMYFQGDGVDKNVFTARDWFEKADKKGYIPATVKLGDIYSEISDCKKAFEYYSIAAEKGNREAQIHLCFMYAGGICTEQDYNKAVLMAKKSSVKGDVLFSLGIYSIDSLVIGKEIDKSKVAEVFELSAEQGNLEAQEFVAGMYYTGIGVSKDTLKAISHVQKDYKCTSCFLIVSTDTAKAFKWYAKAAEQGSVESQLQLAAMLYEGIGTEQNYQKAFEWYKKAAEQGNAIAEERLGDCFFYGKGTEKNINEGINWYNKAMQKGSTTAKEKLSEYYFALAEQNKSDKDEAVKLYEKAAEIGNMEAVYALLSIYAEEGKEEQAVEIYAKAAEKGDLKSQALSIYLDYREDDEPTLRKHRWRNSKYIKNLVKQKFSKDSFFAVCKDYEAKRYNRVDICARIGFYDDEWNILLLGCEIGVTKKINEYAERDVQQVLNNILKNNKEFAKYYN